MKTHVNVGADILAAIDFPYPVVPIVCAHHENWDGTGYPNGLRGEQIPIGARILSVVDCFDALTSDRPYRRAMSQEEALSTFSNGAARWPTPLLSTRSFACTATSRFPRRSQLQALMHNEYDVESRDPPLNSRRSPQRSCHPRVLVGRSPWLRQSGAFDVRIADHARHWRCRVESDAPTYSPRNHGHVCARRVETSLSPVHVAGQAANRLPLSLTFAIGERISGWVAATRHSVADTDAALDLGKGLDDVLRFASSTPLVDRGVIGVLTLYGLEPFGEQLMLTMEMIGPHLARVMTVAGRRRRASSHGFR